MIQILGLFFCFVFVSMTQQLFWIIQCYAILVEHNLNDSWEDVWVHAFVSSKVNIIAKLEFELACLNITNQRFNHNVYGSPSKLLI